MHLMLQQHQIMEMTSTVSSSKMLGMLIQQFKKTESVEAIENKLDSSMSSSTSSHSSHKRIKSIPLYVRVCTAHKCNNV